jgi:hypothetical protein
VEDFFMVADPIIVTGVPRSRTSLTMGILEACGADVGKTCGPTPNNKKGQYECTALIQNVEKPWLKQHGFDQKGQKLPLPPKDLPIDSYRKTKTLQFFSPKKESIWAYKDCKACLSYKSWINAFPDAKWIIVHRQADKIAKSCQRTSFMNAYSTKQEWLEWIAEYRKRLEWLKEEAKNVFEIDSDKIVAGEYAEIKQAVEWCGLSWDALKVQAFVDPNITAA